MGLWNSARGMLQIKLVSADLTGFLSEAARSGIVLRQVEFTDPLTMTAVIARDCVKECRDLAERRGEKLRVLGRHGIYWSTKRLLYRPILLFAMAALLIAVIAVPRHIIFVRIVGNQIVDDNYILEQAEFCGIKFGAARSLVRSEKIKNALLQRIPQLKWVGITTKGCVATITVREKSTTETVENTTGVSSIVASRSGIISEITPVRGNLVCKPGQAVKEGQVLISGYTDCGLSIRATQAEGEVYAKTLHSVQAVAISQYEERTHETDKKTRYALKIGKNLIKLYKGSGISHGSCVKMYSQKNLTLPGGLELPISLVKEELVFYETQQTVMMQEEAEWLKEAARNYLNSQMIAGQVLTEKTELSEQPGLLLVEGQYACHEMIGMPKNEEIILPDGEDD